MDQQTGQTISNTMFRSEKKIRLGTTGLGFRNTSQIQRTKNALNQNEQNISNGVAQTQQHNQLTSTNNNYFIGSNSVSNTHIPSQQNQNFESPQNNQLSASSTQAGFFRRKINVKMSSTNLKAFLNKQPSDNPLMIKSSKNRFISSHMSQGCIQNYNNSNIGVPPQSHGNFFGSQTSLPCPSMSNSSNTHSPQTYNSALNNTNTANSSQTFQTAMNSITLQNNSNTDSRRTINLHMNDQFPKHPASSFKHGEPISSFNRGKRFSYNISKNTSMVKSQNGNGDELKNKINNNDRSDSQDNQDIEDKNEEGNPIRNHSLTKNTIVNYSHNTESTNATAQISQHNYPSQSSHHYFDTDKVKKKQFLTSSQGLIPASSPQINGQHLYLKKKFTEAKQYSNQVRQQMFVQQDQEEEENFLELCETLQKINYD